MRDDEFNAMCRAFESRQWRLRAHVHFFTLTSAAARLLAWLNVPVSWAGLLFYLYYDTTSTVLLVATLAMVCVIVLLMLYRSVAIKWLNKECDELDRQAAIIRQYNAPHPERSTR